MVEAMAGDLFAWSIGDARFELVRPLTLMDARLGSCQQRTKGSSPAIQGCRTPFACYAYRAACQLTFNHQDLPAQHQRPPRRRYRRIPPHALMCGHALSASEANGLTQQLRSLFSFSFRFSLFEEGGERRERERERERERKEVPLR